jgi:hypothetical protein
LRASVLMRICKAVYLLIPQHAPLHSIILHAIVILHFCC